MLNQLREDIKNCFWVEFKYHGMKEKDLTDHEIQALSNTTKFSIWMLRNRYSECVKSIKNIIKKKCNINLDPL